MTALEWLLRVDIYNNNYEDYICNYFQLPRSNMEANVWKYWLAYCYKKIGEELKSILILEELIKNPINYYSFLASDELGKPYNFGNNDIVNQLRINNKLIIDDNIKQAIALYKIGQYKDSSDLWKYDVIKKFKQNEITLIRKLVKVASNNNMYHLSIFNLAISGCYFDMKVFSPLAFMSEINSSADKFGIDIELILSIMRKESSIGAKGLMQVTIPTADFIVKKYKLSLVGENDIYKQIFIPENNIILGSSNLYFLKKLFSNNLILVVSAYNAGPGNVNRWLTKREIDSKQWIENIPFGETRHYIREVLVYIVVYKNFIFNNKYKISDLLDSKISNKQSFR